MGNSLEKYIKFIVDDLVRNTKMNNHDLWVFPFMKALPIDPIRILFNRKPSKSFAKYCIDRYGLTGDEIGDIWLSYYRKISIHVNLKDE